MINNVIIIIFYLISRHEVKRNKTETAGDFIRPAAETATRPAEEGRGGPARAVPCRWSCSGAVDYPRDVDFSGAEDTMDYIM